MIRRLLVTAAGAAAVLAVVGVPAETALEERKAEARQVAQQLAATLFTELEAAIEEGGPTAAIAVCRDAAPAIKTELSLERGWRVTRVGTRVRNPLLGAPDAWEQEVLQEFERRRAAGEAFEDMEHAEVVEGPRGEQLRYMRAIGTQQVCLTCHGTREDMPVDIRNTLDAKYPHDRATGYADGDLRGAFSIRYLIELEVSR